MSKLVFSWMGGTVVLLGSGASVDAGLPTSEGMIDRLLQDFKQQGDKEWDFQPTRLLLEFVVHSLRKGAAGRGDRVGVDVETMFDAIEMLATRSQLPIAPFISAWDPLVAEAERTAKAAQRMETQEQYLVKLLEHAIQSSVELTGTTVAWSDRASENFIRELLGSGDGPGTAFTNLAKAVLRALGRILQLERPDKVRYLEPLATLYNEYKRLDVATLNYDLSVETLGTLVGVPVNTGMDDWHSTGKLAFGEGVRLLKLHGSIDWKLTRNPIYSPDDPRLPFENIRSQRDLVPEEPALIFGTGNKLRAGGPYLELLRQFQLSLEQGEALLVVGYSFRDDHVNAVITAWMNANLSRRMVILDPFAERFMDIHRVPSGGWGFAPVSQGRTLGHDLAHQPKRVRLIQASAAVGLKGAVESAAAK